jgi:integrase
MYVGTFMARPNNKLSSLLVKKDLPPGLYGDGGGLYLQVSVQKTKAWVFRFTRAGVPRKMGLGPVSVKADDKRITLADARQKAAAARSLLIDGLDPIEARNALRTAQAAEQAKLMTFQQCATQCIADRAQGWKGGMESKHGKQWVATLGSYAYPVIGRLSVAAIDQGLVLKIIKPIWQDKTETADRVRNRIEIVLDWAKVHGFRTGDNPARWKGHLDQVLQAPSVVSPTENYPALPYKDLPAFMGKLRQRNSISARALEFTILTAMRTGSVIGAKRPDVDLEGAVWTIPAATLKGRKGAIRKDHIVPLPARAVELLRDLPSEGDFLFPGGTQEGGLSNMAMAEFLDGMGYPPDAATVHGFRSTFKDWAMELTDYPHEMSEIALAHKISDKVDAAYRRGDMLTKRRRLMDDWAAFCARGIG